MPDEIIEQRIRVPRADRSILTVPPLRTAVRLVDANRSLFGSSECSLSGRSLLEIRSSLRREALAVARLYTSSLIGENIPEIASNSLVVNGHQPELFHVGVWTKNFAVAGISQRRQAIGINLIIDNDVLNSTSLRVPVGGRDHLRVERIPFDAPRPAQPWEEAVIRDRETYKQFGSLVSDRIQSVWGFQPIARTTWGSAVQHLSVSQRLSDGFSAVRARLERAWGQNNLELPMSLLCETESFRWFLAHLLSRLPDLHAIYNSAVDEYRRKHKLRNRSQPVTDLEFEDGWYEAPFWIWKHGDLHRGRLFGHRSGSVYELRDEKAVFARFPSPEGSLDSVVDVLRDLSHQGYRLRTRALTTTLFARIFLADLFVHGIGGARYDEMTNRICERFFGIAAPEFLTISATLHMPLGAPFDATESQLCELNHNLRDLTYNPDRHDASLPEALIREKHAIIAEAMQMRESEQLRGRLTPDQHRRLMDINARLRAQSTAVRSEYEARRTKLESQLSANSLIRNREYSFILYPEELVRGFLAPLVDKTLETFGQESKQPLDNGPPGHLA